MIQSRPLLLLGDGIEGLREAADAGAALVLTDIPAGITRAEFDVLPDLPEFFAAAWATLRPNGVIAVLVANMRVATTVAAHAHFRYDLIWEKSIATGFLNSKKQPLRAHEHILVFYRKPPHYAPQMRAGFEPVHAATRSNGHGANYGAQTKVTHARTGATDRYPTSVLHHGCVGTSAPERIHPQQKPVDLMRWLILTYTEASDVVLDPYAGSASTGVAAQQEHRRFAGWESDPEIYQRASARLAAQE